MGKVQVDERKMKKIILILLSIICLSSCYKNNVYNTRLMGASFTDTFSVGDTVTYYMSCNVVDEKVEMYFVRRVETKIGVTPISVADNVYYRDDIEIIITIEDYNYTNDEFIEMLIEKNQISREGDIFKFSSVMYCSWKVFDKMYNKYVGKL